MSKKFSKEVGPKERLKRMEKLIRPFIKKYNRPILVHSTPQTNDFLKIIQEGKLKVPTEKIARRKPHVEMICGLYPSIFFSLGFQYASGYNFKYSLLFSLDLLKETKYYNRSISFQAYRETAIYWARHNPEYLQKLATKSKAAKKVVDQFYTEPYNGETKKIFAFWKCENDVFKLIESYPKKKELIKIYKQIIKERFIKYPKSAQEALHDYDKEYSPEIVALKDIDLCNHKAFLGFYIEGTIPKQVEKILKQKYSGKILFDGKKIRVIKQNG